jgi:hypothetical protein
MGSYGTVRIDSAAYHWYVESQTLSYPGFSHEPIDILRIVGSNSGFDIAVRLRNFESGSQLYAGPMVVLGDRFPSSSLPTPKGARLRLRPKLRSFHDLKVDGECVSRIIAWCLSRHFRAVRANMWGEAQSGPQDDYSIDAPPPRPLTHQSII